MARRINDALDLTYNEIQNVVAQNLSADPGSGVVDGRLYYSTALNALRLRAGGSWTTLASGAGYTDEAAQDAVGTAFANGTQSGVTVTYNDGANSLSIAVTNDETFQDQVGAFLGTNTGSTGITATYDDTNNRMNLAVAYAAPGLTLGTSNSAGSANTALRTDATIAIFDATVPVSQAFGDTAATGSAAFAAHRDHTHGMPANPVSYASPGLTLGTSNAAGSATTLIRSDATIAVFDATAPVTQAYSDSAATGSVAVTARRDHKHGMPAHGLTQHQELIATSDLTDWPRTAALDLNSQKITGLADGSAATDAATFGQLSAAVAGFDWKEPVHAATTATVTLAGGAPNAIDGVTLVVNDRVLVKNQGTASENGVYVVTTLGTGVNGTWNRATDMDAAAEVNQATVLVEAGTVSQGDIYQQTATVTTLGSDTVTWTKVSEGNTLYSADGTTLTLTGTQFSVTSAGITGTQLAASVAGNGLAGGAGSALSVNVDSTTIEINADTLRVAASAAGNGLTGGGGSALAVGAGTGVSVAADSVAVDHATVPMLYATALAGGATSEVITHSLGTRDVQATVYLSSGTYAEEDFSIERTTTNTVTVRSSVSIPSSTYRIVVFG
jgi:hypothetical protein